MKNKLSNRAKKSLALLEEARVVIALFGGFSLVFLTIPVSNEPSITDKISLFINASSSMLLLVSALLLAMTSTVEKSNLGQGDEIQNSLGEVDPAGYKVLVALVCASLGLFVISFLFVTFRVHFFAGFGGVFAIVTAIAIGYFITKKHDEESNDY